MAECVNLSGLALGRANHTFHQPVHIFQPDIGLRIELDSGDTTLPVLSLTVPLYMTILPCMHFLRTATAWHLAIRIGVRWTLTDALLETATDLVRDIFAGRDRLGVIREDLALFHSASVRKPLSASTE